MGKHRGEAECTPTSLWQVIVLVGEFTKPPVVWSASGWSGATGESPGWVCGFVRLFLKRKPQLPSVLGSAGWSGPRAKALGVC